MGGLFDLGLDGQNVVDREFYVLGQLFAVLRFDDRRRHVRILNLIPKAKALIDLLLLIISYLYH